MLRQIQAAVKTVWRRLVGATVRRYCQNDIDGTKDLGCNGKIMEVGVFVLGSEYIQIQFERSNVNMLNA